jgi:AraC-like DNA-binding protein
MTDDGLRVSRLKPGVEEHLDWADSVASSVVETVRGVSPLGSWSYSVWRPPQLHGLIDHLWAYDGPSSHRLKRVFPNGRVEILLNFGDAYRLVEGAGAEACRDAWLSGPQVGPIVLEQPAHQRVMGVRLRPAGAYAVIARPLRETTGLSLDLVDLIGPEASDLLERCEEAISIGRRFHVLAQWISRCFARTRGMDRAVAWAVAQLDASGGAAPIAALRERAGLSETRLVAAFRDQVGLAPKLYGRVVRFRRALGQLQSGRPVRLTEVAFDGQFYDQAHLNAEFRALGGVTPRAFLAARHPVGDGSTVSEGPPTSSLFSKTAEARRYRGST